MKNINVNVDHLTRVEGHGNIVVNVKEGKIEECKWEVVEAPRFFEAFVRGRSYLEIAHITSRICGICSIGHTLCSLQATEAAMGVKISEQTRLLRRILIQGENLQSHVLHSYFLAAPDFVGAPSVFPLVQTHPEVVVRALRMKKLANDLCDVFGGRTVHPITPTVNGFTKLPEIKDIKEIRRRLVAAGPDLEATLALFKTLKIPDFQRETEYISLKSKEEYALYEGVIASTDAGTTPVANYRNWTNEYLVPQSTAKYTKHVRDSYMVGALARFNNNHDQLPARAQKAAEELGLKAPCYNPFMNTVVQVVEVVHALDESIRLIDELLDKGLKEEDRRILLKAGRGVGSVDVPRGILFHDYTYDKNGICVEANCIIPTNQNHANIQKDMEALLPQVLDRPQEEIRLSLEMLVRAYDPCISCSTHLLKVEFV
ncbi:MAG: Ni/Fe hydrogenase subunit alpha [Deltaproteobacteria bacterium]|jgi:coenzyme F420-reducing hydrogenase alpha subunit|nr:Ni/Fe hydrogenase subunit alpha [Deltaproteobacteria bacterium]